MVRSCMYIFVTASDTWHSYYYIVILAALAGSR